MNAPAFDPALYEESRKRCLARLARVLHAASDLSHDPFYELYQGKASTIVGSAVESLILARETLERAELQIALFPIPDAEHRGSRA